MLRLESALRRFIEKCGLNLKLAVFIICYLPLIPPGCHPTEEGQSTKITCDVDATKCGNLFVVKWKLDKTDFSLCTKTSCSSFISKERMDTTITINQTSSTLTVRDVSRTSADYNTKTKWTCSPCGGQGITVCNGLEIYGEFITVLLYIDCLSHFRHGFRLYSNRKK